MNTSLTFSIIFISTTLALVLGFAADRLALRLGLVDDPRRASHKVHLHLTPLVGGIVLLLTLTIVLAVSGNLLEQPVLAIFIPAVIIFLFGLWDDYKILPPSVKILGQLVATLVLVALGVQVQLFQQNWLNLGLTVFWVVGITNAYNFVDSMDGLAIGLASLAAAFFMLITIESQQALLTLFSTILLGAGLGVFYHNAPPARIFLGDSGAQLLGFVLAALAIVYNPLGYTRPGSWFIPILLMGVPIFDTSLVVLSRLRRGKPVYQAGRDHTYHRLVKLGMSSHRAVLTMHTAALLLGALAFIALGLGPQIGNAIFALILLAGVGCFLYLDSPVRNLADRLD